MCAQVSIPSTSPRCRSKLTSLTAGSRRRFCTLKITSRFSTLSDAVSAPASELLDHRALTAGGIESYQLQLPDRLIGSGVCAVELRLDGSAADEPFTAMLGLSLGVPSDATVVRDPALLARIAQAQKALGRDSVTTAELADVASGH